MHPHLFTHPLLFTALQLFSLYPVRFTLDGVEQLVQDLLADRPGGFRRCKLLFCKYKLKYCASSLRLQVSCWCAPPGFWRSRSWPARQATGEDQNANTRQGDVWCSCRDVLWHCCHVHLDCRGLVGVCLSELDISLIRSGSPVTEKAWAGLLQRLPFLQGGGSGQVCSLVIAGCKMLTSLIGVRRRIGACWLTYSGCRTSLALLTS
jgi:hypothetical protein